MCHEKLPLSFCPGVFRLAARDARRKHFVYGDYCIDFGRRWHHLYGVQLHLVAARNRRFRSDEEDEQSQRAAEQSCKYSKEFHIEHVGCINR